jgi:hypothetical protein
LLRCHFTKKIATKHALNLFVLGILRIIERTVESLYGDSPCVQNVQLSGSCWAQITGSISGVTKLQWQKKQELMNVTDAGSRQNILTALCSRYIVEKNKT